MLHLETLSLYNIVNFTFCFCISTANRRPTRTKSLNMHSPQYHLLVGSSNNTTVLFRSNARLGQDGCGCPGDRCSSSFSVQHTLTGSCVTLPPPPTALPSSATARSLHLWLLPSDRVELLRTGFSTPSTLMAACCAFHHAAHRCKERALATTKSQTYLPSQ
jgi:hypothetical protein